MVGHVGDGNYHLIILFNKDDPKEVDEAARLNNNVVDRALALGGSCTGEHGMLRKSNRHLDIIAD